MSNSILIKNLKHLVDPLIDYLHSSTSVAINAEGVRVGRSSGPVDVFAPLVISDAGAVNTFTKLLPTDVARKSSA